MTSLERTLLDLAAVVSPGDLAEIVDDARFHGLDAVATSAYVLAHASGRKGTDELLILLADEDTLRSTFERRYRRDVLALTALPDAEHNVIRYVDGEPFEVSPVCPIEHLTGGRSDTPPVFSLPARAPLRRAGWSRRRGSRAS